MTEAWRRITATARQVSDPSIWASATLAVRTRSLGLKVTSRIVQGSETTFSDGEWSDIPKPGWPNSEVLRFAARLSRADAPGLIFLPKSIEPACFSGIFFGRHVAGTEKLEVEILDVAGNIVDSMGFAVAAAAAVTTAVKPTADLIFD